MESSLKIIGFVILLSLLAAPVAAKVTSVSAEAFVAKSFGGNPPKPKVFWLTKKYKPEVKKILGHKYPALRIRYWGKGARTVWILEEKGKEKPITTGIVINNNRIEQIKILTYRESRGGEVRHEFFTNQFVGMGLRENSKLAGHIDGISGATLSVSAITRLARLALYLHQQTRFSEPSP